MLRIDVFNRFIVYLHSCQHADWRTSVFVVNKDAHIKRAQFFTSSKSITLPLLFLAFSFESHFFQLPETSLY